MSTKKAVNELVERLTVERPIRARSLIITVYGDAIAPRGGTVWLGSLIQLLKPLGLGDRLVRTSVNRLSKEGWLTSSQIGRRSYYSLTRRGWRSFDKAYQRVYHEPRHEWDGEWMLVLTSGVPASDREALRRELGNLGFGVLAPGVLAHPLPPREAVTATLQDLDLSEEAIVMRAQHEGLPTSRPMNRLVRDVWSLDELSEQYAHFLERFRPVWRSMSAAKRLDPEQCFLVRTLLIHEIRRLLLRDPQLPEDVLPAEWSGAAARLLCRNLYRLTFRHAEAHLSSVLRTAEGPLPEPAPYFYKRFGGLLSSGGDERHGPGTGTAA
ncbi:phenylacetic acid degradation operon negative regulatory protein PaaX [Aquisalimonas sp.]|uniref:phenylacetic acid degradation operon negative regulatory protein PaaX n=1 Tax=unclassified Aquisalimonas TaxID=2644645 RepID=UPI0025C57206|nr:phenylacetic acid degradation operon negative regulatory protein PaaX [Aquisalimonas sp.]